MKSFLLFIGITISLFASAQAPEAFSYQAVIRNSAGVPLNSQNISVKFAIKQGSATGASVYEETHTTTTNAFGSIALAVGSGTVVSGTFATIDWGTGPYFLEVAVDNAAGSNFTTLSTTQLLSVPYALYAKSSGGNCIEDIDPADFVFQSENFDAVNNLYQCTFDYSANLVAQLSSGTISIRVKVNGSPRHFNTWQGIDPNSRTITGGASNVSAGDLVEVSWYFQTETCQLKFTYSKQL